MKKEIKDFYRKRDDAIVIAICSLDTALERMLYTLVRGYKTFVLDALYDIIKSMDNYSGGIRIVKGSRKKETVKNIILELSGNIGNVEIFIDRVSQIGFSRQAKESIVQKFIQVSSYTTFTGVYGDPIPGYRVIIPIYRIYIGIKFSIVQLTLKTLSKSVLSKYSGWEQLRDFKYSLNRKTYEDDVQNSLFSIDKALSLFNTGMHKSFFSYASWWIRYGIKSSAFFVDDSMFFPLEDCHLEEKENFVTLPEADNIPKLLDLFKGSFPIPNELRILYYLKTVKAFQRED
jgi:hypothetical protein